jgi:hypothetical protein
MQTTCTVPDRAGAPCQIHHLTVAAAAAAAAVPLLLLLLLAPPARLLRLPWTSWQPWSRPHPRLHR